MRFPCDDTNECYSTKISLKWKSRHTVKNFLWKNLAV
ncbi:hypothetical protein SLEP1_g29926 [Rubroshorea leprosula]|uniref:Uncharacterized protein n=1 Tax=Rubroshorea leprosula TaxID=152421 RepID=A0AAV5K7E1_9ROSI|nr:hypothetical protein SLEP1_g29926 [Rubroshorea leprosula]